MKHLLAVAASIGIAAAAHAAEVPGFARIALDAPHRDSTDRNAVHRRIVDLVADHLGLGG